ncbi:MAG: glycosyltransferase [Saprospiraceae bacterium]
MSKRVLVAPLDWGLGHATRCIPIIQALLQQGAEVILASSGNAFQLLQTEFPDLIIEKLPAYNIRYQTDNMVWNMATQSFKMLHAIYRENRQLQILIKKHQIDAVISDNRLGCFSRQVRSIFITHQINLRLPYRFVQGWIRRINYFFIRQFDECWIPDVPGDASIAGDLVGKMNTTQLRYIGILSRMQRFNLPQRYDVIVVLSGPEPQRTRLEQAILQQIIHLNYNFLLIQGIPGESGRLATAISLNKNVSIVPFLNTKDLNSAIAASDIVICRSGYSSIMDLAVLGKKAIFIPTPRQTEQEYLAERLFSKGIFYYQQQNELNVSAALEAVRHFSGFNPQDYQHSRETLSDAIHQFLQN